MEACSPPSIRNLNDPGAYSDNYQQIFFDNLYITDGPYRMCDRYIK